MRLKILSLIILSVFIILGTCLFYNQILKGGYFYQLSENNRIRLVPEDAARGVIFDAKRRPLVDSTLSYYLVASPQVLKNKKEKARTLDKLSLVLGMSLYQLEAVYKKNYTAPFADIVLMKDIPRELIFKIEQMNLDLPAVSIKPKPQRRYVLKEAGAQVFGFLGEIDKAQLTQLTQYGYRRQDLIGKSGLENSQDLILRGEEGGMQIEVNNRNHQVGILSSKAPVNGTDIQLTIDADLEAFAYEQLKGRRGAVVLMDPNDGRILAMVSSPSFDPNMFISGSDSDQKIRSVLSDKDTPLVNRAIQNQYPPGSIFKIVTTAAGLETKRISESATVFYCPGFYMLGGRRFNCAETKGHGRVNLRDAIKKSCNVFFFKASEKIGQAPLSYYTNLLGFGKGTGVELSGEVKGLVPDKSWKRRVMSDNWYDGDTLNFSIGQGYVLISPIQAAVLISAIANNGKLVQPYLIESIGGAKIKRPLPRQLPISLRTIDIIKDALYSVVESDEGTGVNARVGGLSVSGKTGTAQVTGRISHGWFVGYAPSENPKVAIAVFVENGGYGGEVAAPIAGAVFKKMKQLGMF